MNDKNLIPKEMTDEEIMEESKILFEKEYIKISKEIKKNKLASIKIKNDSTEYDGDDYAQLNMSAVAAISNWTFNKDMKKTLDKISNDSTSSNEIKLFAKTLSKVYTNTYNNRTISWKNANNEIENISIEDIFVNLLMSMTEKSKIILGE